MYLTLIYRTIETTTRKTDKYVQSTVSAKLFRRQNKYIWDRLVNWRKLLVVTGCLWIPSVKHNQRFFTQTIQEIVESLNPFLMERENVHTSRLKTSWFTMDTILGYKAPRVESITDKSFILKKKQKATCNSYQLWGA